MFFTELWIFFTGKQCRVYDDPHIKTFDSADTGYNWYDWHTPCNYSLAQEFSEEMNTYEPTYGVFGNFKYCWGAACVDEFNYMDSWATNIRIGVPHGNFIDVSVFNKIFYYCLLV